MEVLKPRESLCIDLTLDSDDEPEGDQPTLDTPASLAFEKLTARETRLPPPSAEDFPNPLYSAPSDSTLTPLTSSWAARSDWATSEGVSPSVDSQSGQLTPLTLASKEVRQLSHHRMQGRRLCDRLLAVQKRKAKNHDKRIVFLAALDEADVSAASVSIEDLVHDEPAPEANFVYRSFFKSDLIPSLRVNDTAIPSHCNCTDGQCNPETCSCRMMHEQLAPNPWSDLPVMFAYDKNGLLRPQILSYGQDVGIPIWECNELCGCSDRCRNRVVGKHRKVPLTIFKTKTKGWGVRTDVDLPAGHFICTYGGELLQESEMVKRAELYEHRVGTTYIMDLDYYYILDHIYMQPFRKAHPHRQQELSRMEEEELRETAIEWCENNGITEKPYSIDASLYGNVSRYFNHSCDANMSPYAVYTFERDLRMPLPAFFTNRAVKKGEELTLQYSGVEEEAKVIEKRSKKVGKRMNRKRKRKVDNDDDYEEKRQDEGQTALKKTMSITCKCGSSNCRGKVFSTKR